MYMIAYVGCLTIDKIRCYILVGFCWVYSVAEHFDKRMSCPALPGRGSDVHGSVCILVKQVVKVGVHRAPGKEAMRPSIFEYSECILTRPTVLIYFYLLYTNIIITTIIIILLL